MFRLLNKSVAELEERDLLHLARLGRDLSIVSDSLVKFLADAAKTQSKQKKLKPEMLIQAGWKLVIGRQNKDLMGL